MYRYVYRNLRAKAVSLGVLIFAVLCSVVYPGGYAAADSAGWLAAGTPPKWAEYMGTSPNASDNIRCEYVKSAAVRDRPGYLEPLVQDIRVPMCVMRGKHISIAVSRASQGPHSGGTAMYYVGFKGDTKMYPLEFPGEAGLYFVAELIADTDTLVLESTHQHGWFVYENVASRISRVQGGGLDDVRYTFDRTNPTYRFTLPLPSSNLYEIGMGHSNNGRYHVFAAYHGNWPQASGVRYFLLDLQTQSAKLFSVAEKDPTTTQGEYKDFTVSNDGNYIAGGSHPEFTVWYAGDGCGVDASQNLDTVLTDPCSSRQVGKKNPSQPWRTDYGGDYTMYRHTSQYEFADDNKTVTFVNDQYSTQYHYAVSVPGYTPPRLNYLALGDSYSSGEGDTYVDPHTNSKRYREHTNVEEDYANNQPREKCHVSTQSYPYKIAQNFSWSLATFGAVQNKWQTVACSGAQGYDVNEEYSNLYEGQGKGKQKQWEAGGGSMSRLQGYSNKEQLKIDALNEFIPGRQKQVEFVKKYRPKVITLTMGGNDAGFGGIVGLCINPIDNSTCEKATELGRKYLGAELKKQFKKLKELYRELKAASPGVRIYVLGYPQAIVDDENATCPRSLTTINHDERKLFVAGYWYMNQVIHTAARAEGVHYVDTQWALTGHRLCEAGDNAYATGVAMLGTSEAQETFHPNADGHSLIASKFYEELNYENPLTYADYASDANANLTEADIPDSAYLQTATASTRNVEHKASTDSEQTRSGVMNIAFDQFTFLAGSTVQLTLHSDPVDLGTTAAATDGSVSATPSIPSAVPPGYHTLIVSGQTPSGEPIEYEQVVLVKGEDPDDVDDNGVSDSLQLCGPFMAAANEDEDYDGIDDACDPEVTSPILYVARNGDTTKGEDPAKLYIYRNTRASSITGITTDYVDTSSDPENVEALIAASLDTPTSAQYNRFIMLQDTNNPNIKIPTILARDTTNTCIALQPADYLSPALDPADQNYIPRGFIKLITLPGGESCE